MSGCSAATASTTAWCSSNGEVLPPRGLAMISPLARQRCTQRTEELTLTLNCAAAACRVAPVATASTTRSRRSREYALAMPTPNTEG